MCPLRGSNVVPAEPPRRRTIEKPFLVLVGEGPGRKEEIYRVPFIGLSGQLLDETLSEVNVSRAECYVTNAALCRGDSDSDNARAADCCAPRLVRELATMPADIPIVALGKSASKSLLGTKSILLVRGFVWAMRELTTSLKAAGAARRKAERAHKGQKEAELKEQILLGRSALAGRTVFPTLHPAFILRSDTWSPILKLDLDRAARWARGELSAKGLADRITRTKSTKLRAGTYYVSDDAPNILLAAQKLGPLIACDIETESTDPLSPITARILCTGISDGTRTIVIGPWRKEIHSEILSSILATRTTVFHNGYNFDQPALAKDGTRLDPARIEDTLIAHHAFASHFPQRLDHVVSTFLDSSPWKIRFGRRQAAEKGLAPQNMDPDELYFYNACDAVLTARAWHSMQADLADEASVYTHDKDVALLCRSMQETGFAVDRRRKALLSRLMLRRANALKGRLRVLGKSPNLSPARLAEIRRILFGKLRAPMLNPTATGLASTSNATLEEIRKGHGRAAKFSETLLKWRVVVKIRSTYIEACHVHRDRRAHYNWKSFGTVSGRLACRMQSVPRWSAAVDERVREIYTARKGHLLVYFDLSQAEARFAANLSGDPAFIKTCEGDVHAGNALVLFPDAREMILRDAKGKHCPRHADGGKSSAGCNCGKPYRDVAKNAGFAVAYLAEAPTVFAYLRAQGFDVELGDVEAMLGALKKSYWVYYGYVGENVAFVQKNGYLRTAITGRIRWFGQAPPPTEIANFPIQSGIADVMNVRLLALQKKLPRGTRIVGQYHDAAIFETPQGAADEMKALLQDTWAEPVRLSASIVCRAPREFLLPIDLKVGKRWSEF